jgi:Rod binding domain-containing protein
LDGRKFAPYKPEPDLKTTTATPSGTSPSPKQASFKQTLANAQAARGNSASRTDADKAKDAGREMEAFFLSYIFKQAFNNKISSGLFGDSYASQMYLEMFIDAASEQAAKSTPLGIADMIVADINRGRQTEEEKANETQKLL